MRNTPLNRSDAIPFIVELLNEGVRNKEISQKLISEHGYAKGSATSLVGSVSSCLRGLEGKSRTKTGFVYLYSQFLLGKQSKCPPMTNSNKASAWYVDRVYEQFFKKQTSKKNHISLRDIIKNEFIVEENIQYGDIFEEIDISNWLKRKYPSTEYKRKTIYNYLTKLSTNCPGRIKGKWLIKKGEDDLFYKLSPTTYRLYEPAKDYAPIYELNDITDNAYVNRQSLNEINIQIGDFDPTSEERHIEGKTNTVFVNRYERDAKARIKCLEIYGYQCNICKFDFENIYGNIGKKFIHVHHIVPLSEIGEEYSVSPQKDLIPVCPNCHAMLHRANILPSELKKIMRENNG